MSEAQFNKAVEIVQSLPSNGPVQPSLDDKLFFYQYFKQATLGDNNTDKPGMLDFTGKTKWTAWTSVKGTTKEECYKKYVDKLKELLRNSGEEGKVTEIEAA